MGEGRQGRVREMEFRGEQGAFPSATWERGACGRQLMQRFALHPRWASAGYRGGADQLPVACGDPGNK